MHVFVSHSSSDAEIATAYADALETAGYKAWISSRDIRPGASWQAEIARALSSAQAVVFLLSAAAAESPQVRKEITFAESLRKPLLPIVLADCPFPFSDPALQFIFLGFNITRADDDPSITVNRLLESIPPLAVDSDESVESEEVAPSRQPSTPTAAQVSDLSPALRQKAERIAAKPDSSSQDVEYAFDPNLGIYYVNVGEYEDRSWDDCRRYGFLAAGGAPKWSDPIRKLVPGDIIVAYLKGHGYVGVGRVAAAAVPFAEFEYDGGPLSEQELTAPGIAREGQPKEDQEYLARIEWICNVPRQEAKFRSKSGLFTSMLIRASLSRQPATVEFVNSEFGVDLVALATGDASAQAAAEPT